MDGAAVVDELFLVGPFKYVAGSEQGVDYDLAVSDAGCVNWYGGDQCFPATDTRKLQQAERCGLGPELAPWRLLSDDAIHEQLAAKTVVFAEPFGGGNTCPVDAFSLGKFADAVLGVEDGVSKDVWGIAGAVGAEGTCSSGFVDDPATFALGDVSGDCAQILHATARENTKRHHAEIAVLALNGFSLLLSDSGDTKLGAAVKAELNLRIRANREQVPFVGIEGAAFLQCSLDASGAGDVDDGTSPGKAGTVVVKCFYTAGVLNKGKLVLP